MLLNDFFHIRSSQNEQQTLSATLQINTDHAIFNGHFPGQPVVPGVCMMQMIKEILEKEVQKKLRLKTADHLKFLSIIDPRVHNEIQAEIKSETGSEGIKVTASLFSADVVFFKCKSLFHIA